MLKRISVRECEVVYRPRAHSLPSRVIASSESVYALMSGYVDRAHESVWVVLLQARQKIVGVHECARGNVSSVPVAVSTVYRSAIVVGAAAVIVVHNHPSGDPNPSPEDHAFTDALARAGELLGVPLLDHVIIAESGYYSMLDAGKMKAPVST